MYELSIGLKIGIKDVIIGLEFISFDVFQLVLFLFVCVNKVLFVVYQLNIYISNYFIF